MHHLHNYDLHFFPNETSKMDARDPSLMTFTANRPLLPHQPIRPTCKLSYPMMDDVEIGEQRAFWQARSEVNINQQSTFMESFNKTDG